MKINQLYKLFTVFFSLLTISNSLSAQVVGINLPKGKAGSVFHIDAAGDNTASISAAQAANDVIITNTGQVGIGTVTPSTQVHLKTTSGQAPLRLSDGAEKNTKVLYSQLDGTGFWSPYGSYTLLEVPLSASKTFSISEVSSTTFKYSGTSFQLEPGIWMIDLQLLVLHYTGTGATNSANYNDRAWFKFGLSDSSTAYPTSSDHIPGTPTLVCDFLYKVGPAYNMITGIFFLNNKTSNPKNYYLWFGGANIIGSIPANEKFTLATAANESMMTATYLGNSYNN